MLGLIHRLRHHRPSEQGQGLVEYALILVLVAVVVIVILSLLGPQIGDIFGRINCEIMYRNQHSQQLEWSQVWDSASYDRFLQRSGLLPGGFDGSQLGCWGINPEDDADPNNVGPLPY